MLLVGFLLAGLIHALVPDEKVVRWLGAANNAASIVVLAKIMGRRALLVYVLSIAVCSLAAGYALDAIYDLAGIAPAAVGDSDHGEQPGRLGLWAALLLVALCAGGLWRQYARRLMRMLKPGETVKRGRLSERRED